MSTSPHTPAAEAAARLTRALRATADALAASDLDALLASETGLRHALATLTIPASVAPAEREALVRQVDAARSALGCCRQYGAALSDFVRISLDARGGAIAYPSSIDPRRTSRAGARA